MQVAQPSKANKEDNLFGVCAALGEDFGFNPLYLRITLGVLLLWNPWAVVGGYAAAGVVVAFSRLLFPARRRGESAPQIHATPSRAPAPVAQDPQGREAEDAAVKLAHAA